MYSLYDFLYDLLSRFARSVVATWFTRPSDWQRQQRTMQPQYEPRLLMLVTMIVMKFDAPATATAASELADVRRGGPPANSVGQRIDCQSYGSVPTIDGLLSPPADGNEVKENIGDDEAIGLGPPVNCADTSEQLTDDDVQSENPDRRRRRRSLRPVKTVELAETGRGQLLTLGTDYAERFAFKDSAPHQLDISAVMGHVLLRDGHRLDYETEPDIEFVVIVTRVDDVACECIIYYFNCCRFNRPVFLPITTN